MCLGVQWPVEREGYTDFFHGNSSRTSTTTTKAPKDKHRGELGRTNRICMEGVCAADAWQAGCYSNLIRKN